MTQKHPDLRIDLMVFAFETGMTFEGFSVTAKDDRYVFTLRGRNNSGEAYYATMVFDEFDDGLFRLYRAVSSRMGRDVWRPDKFR
jgi:hypothetical protein